MKLSVQGVGIPSLTNVVRAAAKYGAIATVAALMIAPLQAHAAEHSLAGIRIFAPVKEVLSRFGNPTHVLTGADALGGAPSAGTPAAPAPGDGGPTAPPMSRPPEFGGAAPGGPPAPGGANPTGAADGTTPDAATLGEVMYVYQNSNGTTLEFLASPDGRVIQITVLGYKGSVKTAMGITLGSLYTAIVKKYGYPEGQDNTNGVLTMKYLNKQHVAFNLQHNKVVGITVAAME